MAKKRDTTSGIAYDDDFWVDAGQLGSVHDLCGEGDDDEPAILVPDGNGDYREHRPETRRRLGF
jgi:hypothetical protein